ncbi:MAG: YeeE/YedE family protein [Rhodospirillaceae bacterium]|nr:YeeE/YedE family protein [Rhodospirillales bacterium]MBT3907251.1 YeeE/YedE family protein [Rhodospirillaceae bacterium]MBT4701957.1 YeeE/YedE family protein [Rhodospirillaceae bacterium]MBT5036755.1 YeeE/YedE family protein [Rhodospirillaceae bacterium]MBT6220346.1 YeeE/YedE family protein [Rhodospirillaceae bacterium]
MENFTPFEAILGGVLIGLSSVILLWGNGRIAGVSGIMGGILSRDIGSVTWRILFAMGLIAGVFIYRSAGGALQDIEITSSLLFLLAGGGLVGFGSSLGSGCTSGHGVCGLGRRSGRSLAATMTFMGVAGITVYVTRHLMGAAL